MRPGVTEMVSAPELTSNQFTMCDSDVEMSPGNPCDQEFKFPEFDLISDVVDSEMSKMTQEEKRKFVDDGFPEDPRCWTTRQLMDWIQSMVKRCSIEDSYTTTIQTHDIDGDKLCSMTESEFKSTFPDDDVIYQCLKYWKEVPVPIPTDVQQTCLEYDSYEKDSTDDMNLKQIIREAMMPEEETDLPSPAAQSDSGYSDMSESYQTTDPTLEQTYTNLPSHGTEFYQPKNTDYCYGTNPMWGRAPNPLFSATVVTTPPQTPLSYETHSYSYGAFTDSIKSERPQSYYGGRMMCVRDMSYQEGPQYSEDVQQEWASPGDLSDSCTSTSLPKMRRKGPGRPPKPDSEKKRKKVGRWQPLLWEYILRCLDGDEMAESREMLEWVDRNEGLFKFFSGGKETFAQSWGEKKGNRKTMTYQKMARALRDYAKKDIIVKYKKKLHYKFTADDTLRLLKSNRSSVDCSFMQHDTDSSATYGSCRKGERA